MCSFVKFLRPTKSCATFFGPPDMAQFLAVWAQIKANKNKQLFGKAWEWLKSAHNHWNAGTINENGVLWHSFISAGNYYCCNVYCTCIAGVYTP